MNKNKIIFIDNFRLFLCLIVIISHVLDFLEIDNIFNNKIDFLAVCIFFVLSGYLNYFSILNNKDNFLKRRFKRLLPKYYFVIFLSFIISIYFNTTEYQKYFYNLFFLQHLNGVQSISENVSLWSLSYEFVLYFLLSIYFNRKFIFFLILPFLLFYSSLNSTFSILIICFLLGMLLLILERLFDFDFNFKMKDLKFGKYTYEIYIFHYPLLFIFFNI